MIDYDDLEDARAEVMRLCRRDRPEYKSLDTTGPSVAAGLLVVEFEIFGAMEFAREITRANLVRIRESRKQYQVDLFTAAYASGMTTGAQAERRRT